MKLFNIRAVFSTVVPRNLYVPRVAASSGVGRKFSWQGFHSVAYGGHLFVVCSLCDVTIWHHIHVSKPTFWRSLL